MNLANLMTVSRFPLMFVVVALLYWPFRGAYLLAFLLYLLSGLSDWADGYLARRCSMVSNFGKFMDALSDKILVIGLLITLLFFRLLPPGGLFCLLLVLGREFFVTGIRLVAVSKNVVIAAERSGKIKTILQMVCVGAFLCELALVHDLKSIIFFDFFQRGLHFLAVVLFYLSSFWAFVSGVLYTMKYRHVFN